MLQFGEIRDWLVNEWGCEVVDRGYTVNVIVNQDVNCDNALSCHVKWDNFMEGTEWRIVLSGWFKQPTVRGMKHRYQVLRMSDFESPEDVFSLLEEEILAHKIGGM